MAFITSVVSGLNELKKQLALDNLARLAAFEPPKKPANADANPCDIGLQLLTRWSTENEGAIKKAFANQVFGAKQPLDWNNAFFAFMESTAMYLRDFNQLAKAWDTFRGYKMGLLTNPNTLEAVLTAYKSAYSGVEAIAKYWGMEVIIIDMVERHPDGRPHWDGPFCAIFYTVEQKDKPFIGVAFKGTNPTNIGEVAVDYNYNLMNATGFLGDTAVSEGVYNSLFGKYGAKSEIPYNLIAEAIASIVKKIGPSTVHVTGHSLGGSYSSFCYTQLLLDQSKTALKIGDEYTFGAPRVGSRAWAKCTQSAVDAQPGLAWRIVHDKDIVPQVPPTTLKATQLDFHHVDSAWQIFRDKVPLKIDSELDVESTPVYKMESFLALVKAVFQTMDHLPNGYKDGIVYAIANSKQ